MTTNEKIVTWLKLEILNYTGTPFYKVTNKDQTFKLYSLKDIDFLHDRNQQKWIIDELKKKGYKIVFCIDNEESDCMIYSEEIEGERDLLHYYANSDDGFCLIQAIEQLIDKENKEEK